MGLFGANYENPGAGIAKDAPKKKGFFRFMEIFGRKFWKLLELNFLYMLFYLPLVAASFVYYRCAPGGLRYGLLAIFLLAFAVCFGPALAGHTKILRNFTLEKPVFMVHDFLKTCYSTKENRTVKTLDIYLFFQLFCDFLFVLPWCIFVKAIR